MGISGPILAITISLHLIAFVFAVGAERRRSTAHVVPDEYDEKTYCKYDTDASTVYGLTAFGLLLLSQTVVNSVTKCMCFGRRRMMGRSSRYRTFAVFFFVISWITFLAAQACLLAGSAKNAYHTKYRAIFRVEHLSCATLRKGVFAASAALILISMMASISYYWAHSMADTGGWERHENDQGLGMTAADNYTAENPKTTAAGGY